MTLNGRYTYNYLSIDITNIVGCYLWNRNNESNNDRNKFWRFNYIYFLSFDSVNNVALYIWK